MLIIITIVHRSSVLCHLYFEESPQISINTSDSLSVSPKKNELPTKNPNMTDAKVENPTFKKWREPAHYRVFENKLDGVIKVAINDI